MNYVPSSFMKLKGKQKKRAKKLQALKKAA